jgi:hypothetical protein
MTEADKSKSEALARQFEAKARDASKVLRGLSDADWRQTAAGEGWTVGATAHHLAGSLAAVAGIVTAMAAGQWRASFTRAMLDQQNAAHAREHAACSRSETVELFDTGVAAAVTALEGLRDDQLATSAHVFSDAPPLTVEQLVTLGLLGHVDEHIGSIRKAAGR